MVAALTVVAVTNPNCAFAPALPIVAALTALAVNRPVSVVVEPLSAAPALPIVAALTVLAVSPLAAFNDVNEPVLAVVDPTGVF